MSKHQAFPAAVALLLAQAVLALPSRAADALPGQAPCCETLEDRVAELEALAVKKGNRKVSLTVSGIITWPLMGWYDGKDSDVFIVSNEVKRPRWRFDGKAAIAPGYSAGYVIEIGPNPSPFAPMDQKDFVASSELYEIRHNYWWAKSDRFGQFSLGLQSQAIDGVTEVSLANTSPVVSPGLPILLGYLERGWFMRKSDGTLTDMRFGDILFHGRNDIWGEGHRWDVARYDSPVLAGFTFSASWGMDDAKDIALRYAGDFGRLKFAAALGLGHWNEGGLPNKRGCARVNGTPDLDCWEIGGSFSMMDTESGLFLNAAAGYGKDNNVRRLYGGVDGVDDGDTFHYLVAGVERQWLPLGKTTLFGHYWHRDIGAGVFYTGDRVNATPLGAGAFVSAADVTLYGAGFVQTLAEGVDVYGSLNRAETSVSTSADGASTGATTTAIEPFDFVIAGLSVRF